MSETSTGEVTSQDGTRIVFDRTGEGPPVILVGGALSDRRAGASFAAELSSDFTAYAYDRRGRGDSGDTPPYVVEREVEDLDALIREAGGRAFLFGVSSGAALVLETAARSGGADKLAVYEPPYDADEGAPRIPIDFVEHLDELCAADRRGDAVEYFMTTGVGLSPQEVAQMRGAPFWPGLEALAHTLPYDGRIVGFDRPDRSLPVERWKAIQVSVLALAGGASPDRMRNVTRAVAEALPDATYRSLPEQTHQAEPAVVVPVLREFFLG
ncbi:MAG TPA: alpha/beta hydrolase [Actinomycetota bacterium]|nr:alpha/beta hydrolase [Actinomycetota bacterium]